MRLQNVTIRNFKAIEHTRLDLTDFNVIVGANGSGKSSVLQAMHWMFQSGRNRSIEPTKVDKGSTLSERDATFMPSPNYRNAGHGHEYGNKNGTPQLDMSVEALLDDGATLQTNMSIKSARNEGISVHVPSGNAFVVKLRERSREFSAYIPGLAGIPLSEEKRTKLIVERLAAAGDANTVLRNVLHLLKDVRVDGQDGLTVLQSFVSRVMGGLTIEVDFDDDQHSLIQARFQTAEMSIADPKRFKPLELAGIGFLQVIQIFAYLVYFRPVVLLVDEPDSHLHPTAQERLVTVLADAARGFNTQVMLTTHSPSVIRSLPPDARVIWMKGGKVQESGDTEGRRLMGWGLLDRRVLFMTEDKEAGMLQALLTQWPDLDRLVAVWPFNGSSSLPSQHVVSGLIALTGGSLKVVLHRDRDFMTPAEITILSAPYESAGHKFWFTRCSDIESYWAEPEIIATHFDISDEDARTLLDEAATIARAENKALTTRRNKRIDAMNKIGHRAGVALPQLSDAEVQAEACLHGIQHDVLGKDLLAAIRGVAQRRAYKGATSFGKAVPTNLTHSMAPDLEVILRAAVV
jgi:ABC-type dipeptide/oligopeptide/nickel transport system ATPase component